MVPDACFPLPGSRVTTSTLLGIAGGIAGAAIGAPFGMAALGWAIGSAAGGIVGNILDPTIAQQPGLNDKKLQTSQYGTMLTYVWGRFRLAGSVSWIGNNGELVEHSQSSGGKGGGNEVETKSYTGSWEVRYCKSTRTGQQAIVAIDKHWCDGRVVTESDINPTVYIGWSQQLPDSSMEADLGVGQVPADRYIGKEVYNEVQMEQFFNRLPQMEALVRTVASSNGPLVQVASNNDTDWANGKAITIWSTDWEGNPVLDNPAATAAYVKTHIEDDAGVHNICLVGTYVYADTSTTKLYVAAESGYVAVGMAAGLYRPPVSASPTAEAPGNDFLEAAGVETGRYCHGISISPDGKTVLALTGEDSPIDLSATADMWHRIVDGTIAAEGTIGTTSTSGLNRQNFGVSNVGGAVSGSISVTANALENNGEYVWNYRANSPYSSDATDPAKTPLTIRLLRIEGGVLSEYALDPEYLGFGGPQQTTIGGSCYVTEEGYLGVIAHGNPEAFPVVPGQTALYTRIGSSGQVSLATILSDVFELKPSSVGDLALTPERYDVTAAESVFVHGANYGAQMQKRNFIAMLEAAYNFDIVESDDGEDSFLKVVFRGGGSVAEIPNDDLGIRDDGDAPVPLLELVARLQDWELPARVNVVYYDPDQEYLLGSQFAQRAWPYVDNVTQIDLPIVMSAARARDIAKRELYRAHLERDTYGWSTSRKWAHLEPTDVVTIQGRILRIIKKTETPSGVIRWEGVLSAAFSLEEEPTEDAPSAEGVTPNPPKAVVTTELVLLDIPILSQSHAPFGFYAAMGPTGPGRWTGATLFKSLDDGDTWIPVASSNRADVIGTVAEALPSSSGSPADVLTVTLTDPDAELSSCTAEALANGANLFALQSGPQHWELCQFMTATLVASQTYEITVDVRGVKDSAAYMTGHAAGDKFVLLPCVNVDAPVEELNLPFLYRAVTFGMPLPSSAVQEFTNTGEAADDWHEVVDGHLPSNAAGYVLTGPSTSLPNGRTLTAGTGIDITDNGPGNTIVVSASGGSGVPDIDDSADIVVEPIGSPPTSVELHLTETGVTPGFYGATFDIPIITVDAKGRVTALATTPHVGTIVTMDEGALVDDNAIALNFVGDGVTATDAGYGVTTITIPGGGGAGGTYHFQEFTLSGTFSVPADIDPPIIWVSGTGAGGGGRGGPNSSNAPGHGGGSGQYAVRQPIAVTPGGSVSVTVGAAGAASSIPDGSGGDGGDTIVGSLTLYGGKGAIGPTGSSGAGGGNAQGQGGANGVSGTAGVRGSAWSPNVWGGSSGGTGAFGVDPGRAGGTCGIFAGGAGGTGSSAGGGGASSAYGVGGTGGAPSANGNAPASTSYGAGGGGGGSKSAGGSGGGAGAAGYVLIEWYE